jgi:hypothetical protein
VTYLYYCSHGNWRPTCLVCDEDEERVVENERLEIENGQLRRQNEALRRRLEAEEARS